RLKGQRLDFAARLAVRFERIRRIGEAAAGFKDLAHAVDGVQQVAGVYTTGSCPRQREVSGGFEDPLKSSGRREHTGPAVVVTQGVERHADTVGRPRPATTYVVGLKDA